MKKQREYDDLKVTLEATIDHKVDKFSTDPFILVKVMKRPDFEYMKAEYNLSGTINFNLMRVYRNFQETEYDLKIMQAVVDYLKELADEYSA